MEEDLGSGIHWHGDIMAHETSSVLSCGLFPKVLYKIRVGGQSGQQLRWVDLKCNPFAKCKKIKKKCNQGFPLPPLKTNLNFFLVPSQFLQVTVYIVVLGSQNPQGPILVNRSSEQVNKHKLVKRTLSGFFKHS